jgi:uncharacterized alkaline shock family protein YloU
MTTETLEKKAVDPKEIDYPETVYIRDIENRVFQMIVLQTLAKVKSISLIEGNFFDTILKKTTTDSLKGIEAEQDGDSNMVNVRIEIDVEFGIPIPDKAEEIQTRVTEEITRLTGIHVSSVHVIFKNVMLSPPLTTMNVSNGEIKETPSNTYLDEDLKQYNKDF